MYGIHHKLFGISYKDLKSILKNHYQLKNYSNCLDPCDPDVICDLCAFKSDGPGILPDIHDLFWTSYSGDDDYPLALGIRIDSCDEFDENLSNFFQDLSVPAGIEDKFNELFLKLPQSLINDIQAAKLKPKIIFERGTS